MAAQSTVESWSVHHGLFAAVEPRSELRFPYDGDRHKIAKQMLKIRNEAGGQQHLTYKVSTVSDGGLKKGEEGRETQRQRRVDKLTHLRTEGRRGSLLACKPCGQV